MKYITKNSKFRLIIPMLVALGLAVSSLHVHNEIKLYQTGIAVSTADSHFECPLCDAVFQIQDLSENEFIGFIKSEFLVPETSPRLDSFLAKLNRDQRAPPFPV